MASYLTFCTLLFSLYLLSISVQGQEEFLAKDVAGAVLNGEGAYEIEHNGVKYLVVDDPNKRMPFFYNPSTTEASWNDPRSTAAPVEPIKPPRKTTTVFFVTILPFMAFAMFVVGRVYYLQKYYPELLWPTKERKLRYRNNSKFKPQKARGKMNQDGKGGRSANS